MQTITLNSAIYIAKIKIFRKIYLLKQKTSAIYIAHKNRVPGWTSGTNYNNKTGCREIHA